MRRSPVREFAAIAARFDDKNTDTSSKFTDIASHWAKNEIGIAANKGWINGYPDDTFRPNQYITRAEAMTLVNRVLNRLPENSSDLLDSMIKWPDNSDASAWYYLAVQEATNSHAYRIRARTISTRSGPPSATLVTGPSLKSKYFPVRANESPGHWPGDFIALIVF